MPSRRELDFARLEQLLQEADERADQERRRAQAADERAEQERRRAEEQSRVEEEHSKVFYLIHTILIGCWLLQGL
jgi:hypothetical protein